MAETSLPADGPVLLAQAGESTLTIDPDTSEGRVTVQQGSPVQLDAFELAGSTVEMDGGALLIDTEGGTMLRIMGLSDEPVTFADGTIDGAELRLLATMQDGAATVTGFGEDGIDVTVASGETVDLSGAGISNQAASLGDMNNVAIDTGDRTVTLTGLGAEGVQFTEGSLSGDELVSLLASRRAGTAADLEQDLADGNATVTVMEGVPVDLSAYALEDATVTQSGDRLLITLSDGKVIELVGLSDEPVVFADTIMRGEPLTLLAGEAGTGDAAQGAAVDLPQETAAITVDVQTGETVDLTEYELAGASVVLDGETLVITLADGQELRLVGLGDEQVQFADTTIGGTQIAGLAGDTPALVAPAAGPAAGPADAIGPAQPGGGTTVDAAQQGPLGSPLPLAALIDPTELGFGGIDPRPGLGEGDDLASDSPGEPGEPGGPPIIPPNEPPPGGGDVSPVSYNAQLGVGDQPIATNVGYGASSAVPIDLGDDGPGPGTTPTAGRDSGDIGNELVGVDTVDGRILDGLLIVDLPDYGGLLYDFNDGAGLTPITADMILGGANETVFPVTAGNDFYYQAYGVYGDGAATWQQAIDQGFVESITANAIGGADEFVLAEVSSLDGPGQLDNTSRLGVTGNTTYQDYVDRQIGHDSRAGTGSEVNVSTEALRIDFAVDVGAMQFEAIRLFADEFKGGDEVGRWTAYQVDANGNATVVGTDTFTGTDPRNPGALEGDLIVNVDTGGATFNRIEFTVLPYSNAPGVAEPTAPNNYESSDYSLNNIKVTPADGDQFQYLTFVDNDANEAYDPGVDVASAPATVYLDTEIV